MNILYDFNGGIYFIRDGMWVEQKQTILDEWLK